MDQFITFLELLADGLWITIMLTLASGVLAIAVAVLAGVARRSDASVIRAIATIYVELFRGTSCYVQLFWVFFVLPLFGVTFSPYVAAIVVLGLNVGSYGSEVVRGALGAVPRGQSEAAVALNFSRLQNFYYIQFPQAMRIALPPIGNLLVDLLKITPMVSLVTISDLTYNTLLIRQQTGETFLTFSTILIVYFILSSIILFAVGRAEAYFNRGAELLSNGVSAR